MHTVKATIKAVERTNIIMTLVFSSDLIVFSLSALPYMFVVPPKVLSVVTLVYALVRR